MARILAISNGETVQYVDGWQIAVDGTIRPVASAFVAVDGNARQFWPPQEDSVNKRILWSTTQLTVRNQAQFNATSVASIKFTRSSGIYTYDNHPSGPANGQFLSPALDGTPAENNKILIRVTQISGDVLTGILGVWIDMNISEFLEWSLDHSGIGSSNAVAEIDIAEDNGAGAPLGTTVVTKTVTFISEVTGESGILWSSVQRDLVEIKETVDADCTLRFDPSGTATGEADTSGSFTEAWAGTGVDPADFMLNVSVISGTYPSGVLIDTEMPLNIVRTMVLLATSDEDLNNELDVRVRDTVFNTSITKRVTMHSQRFAESTPPVWTPVQWNLSDVGYSQPLSHSVNAHIIFQLNGVAIGRIDNDNLDEIQETETWLPAGDSASDYEVKIRGYAGEDLLTSHIGDQWYPMTVEQHFLFEGTTLPAIREYIYEVFVRKIGSASVSKDFIFTITGAGEGIPD